MRVIHEYQNGKLHQVNKPRRADSPIYVICCQYGDWSNFRTIAEIEDQNLPQREDGFYWTEER